MERRQRGKGARVGRALHTTQLPASRMCTIFTNVPYGPRAIRKT